jgi:hypothetical protein
VSTPPNCSKAAQPLEIHLVESVCRQIRGLILSPCSGSVLVHGVDPNFLVAPSPGSAAWSRTRTIGSPGGRISMASSSLTRSPCMSGNDTLPRPIVERPKRACGLCTLQRTCRFPAILHGNYAFYHGQAREHRSGKRGAEAVFCCCADYGRVNSDRPVPRAGRGQSGLAVNENTALAPSLRGDH